VSGNFGPKQPDLEAIQLAANEVYVAASDKLAYARKSGIDTKDPNAEPNAEDSLVVRELIHIAVGENEVYAIGRHTNLESGETTLILENKNLPGVQNTLEFVVDRATVHSDDFEPGIHANTSGRAMIEQDVPTIRAYADALKSATVLSLEQVAAHEAAKEAVLKDTDEKMRAEDKRRNKRGRLLARMGSLAERTLK
jgi:hypothetical protein